MRDNKVQAILIVIITLKLWCMKFLYCPLSYIYSVVQCTVIGSKRKKSMISPPAHHTSKVPPIEMSSDFLSGTYMYLTIGKCVVYNYNDIAIIVFNILCGR